MATPGFSDQNVYQMWIAGHEQGDVWIRRTTWSSLCARVVRVGEMTGPAPYSAINAATADRSRAGG